MLNTYDFRASKKQLFYWSLIAASCSIHSLITLLTYELTCVNTVEAWNLRQERTLIGHVFLPCVGWRKSNGHLLISTAQSIERMIWPSWKQAHHAIGEIFLIAYHHSVNNMALFRTNIRHIFHSTPWTNKYYKSFEYHRSTHIDT